MNMHDSGWLYKDWPLTVIPLEENPDNPRFVGTGFYLNYDKTSIPLICIVTNRHIVEERRMMYRANLKNGTIERFLFEGEGEIESISLINKWFFHPNNEVDLAIHIVKTHRDMEACSLPTNYISKIDEISEGDDLFYIGFPIGIGAEIDQPYHPIIRTGTIAQKKHRDKFIIEATVFPGSSGSPIFKKPYLLKVPETIEDLKIMNLIGIVSEYISYRDIAISQQTKRPRIIFSENSGLTTAISAECIFDILDSEEFINTAELISEAVTSGIME